jgi:hygromycin-B 4-O-kinase
MSNYKTRIDEETVESFLKKKYKGANDVQRITGGESSQAFSFSTPQGRRVLRVNVHGKHGFMKDQIAYQKFSSELLKIPEILGIGEIKPGIFYAVSVHSNGKMLNKLTNTELAGIVPELIKTLDAIHAISPLGTGYGEWDLVGNADRSSWRDVLLSYLKDNEDDTTQASFYDAELHKRLRNEAIALIEFCPEGRKLVHGDYGFDNILSDGKHITGVIDWEQSRYGDPLYDIAWLDRKGEEYGYGDMIKQHYISLNRLPEHYDERLACYKLLIRLDSLGFYAYSRQQEKYESVKRTLLKIKSNKVS